MSRSGYSDDGDQWQLIMWRGQVAATIRGKRGQAFLLELVQALDAMPEKRLIENDLQAGAEVCALGCVGVRRGLDMARLDPEDYDAIAAAFGLPHQLVQEIEWLNDEGAGYRKQETPEERWRRVRDWAVKQLLPVETGEPLTE